VAGDTMHGVASALGRISLLAFTTGTALAFVNFIVAAMRFRTLLRAYGATANVPSLAEAVRLYLVAHFFNTALPGNLVGDVMRGHQVRAALPSGGGYLVVLLERVFGLAALLLLASSIALVRGLATSPWLFTLTVCGFGGAALGAAVPMMARAVGSRVGGRIEQCTRELPVVVSRRGLGLAFIASVATQVLVALAGFAILEGLAPHVSVLDAMALIPLALLATYFPTIAGLGARELAFVALLAPLGVAEAEATAASLGLLGTQLVAAFVGGLLHLVAARELRGTDGAS
jgi:glycosyltransferase 2 family protein